MVTTSFKQFLDSRNQLSEAQKSAPKSTMRYVAQKYTTIKIRQEDGTVDELQVRPQYLLTVEWAFDENRDGIVMTCILQDRDGKALGKGVPDMLSQKFQKWLNRFTAVTYK